MKDLDWKQSIVLCGCFVSMIDTSKWVDEISVARYRNYILNYMFKDRFDRGSGSFSGVVDRLPPTPLIAEMGPAAPHTP